MSVGVGIDRGSGWGWGERGSSGGLRGVCV